MFSWALLLLTVLSFGLAGCGFKERIAQLESEQSHLAIATDQQRSDLALLRTSEQRLTTRVDDLSKEVTTVADQQRSDSTSLRTSEQRLTTRVDDLSKEVDRLRAVVTGSSRLRVTIEPTASWKTVYANSSGISQRVRITHTGGNGASQLLLRAQPVRAEPSVPGDPSSTPIGASPEWDLTAVGAQRWIRLACGLEIKGRSSGSAQILDVLIAADPHPISCDQ